jgi:hypothetical protein
MLYIYGTSIPQEQIDKLRKTIIIAPSDKESQIVGNLLSLVDAQKDYFMTNGRYASSWDELTSSGSLFVPTGTPMQNIYPNYDLVRFDGNKDSFTVIAAPQDRKGNENLRIFAVSQDGLLCEWIGSRQDFDPSTPLDNEEKWNQWSEGFIAELYGCGPGG